MQVWENLKNYFYRRFLRNKTAYAAISRVPTNYDRARNIGIIIDAGDENHRAAVIKYAEALRKDGKNVDIRGFANVATPVDNFPFKTWNTKQLSWSGQLSEEAGGQFWNTQYDYLLNLNPTPCQALETVAALSRAHLRVGAYHAELTDFYDVMVDLNGGNDVQNLIGQIDFYIKKINKNA
ncbi:MAG: hypothetical protein RI894_707 [Bacteroidota bacterium]